MIITHDELRQYIADRTIPADELTKVRTLAAQEPQTEEPDDPIRVARYDLREHIFVTEVLPSMHVTEQIDMIQRMASKYEATPIEVIGHAQHDQQ